MSTLSLIQLLPLLVVKQVVSHVVGGGRTTLDEAAKDSQEYKALLKPLLWVSSNFRAVALPLYCNNFKMKMSLAVQADQSDYCVAYKYLGHPTHHLAKELEIELDERAIGSGKALDFLSGAPYDGCAFPLAFKLTLSLTAETPSDVDESAEIALPTAEANIGAFVGRVKQIVPAVRDIRVQPEDEYSPEIGDHLAGYLVAQLFQLVGRIDYDYGYRGGTVTRLWKHLDAVCNLTHITYTNMRGCGCFLQSVRQNAPTLQDLDIDSEHYYVDICGLIRNTDGNSITYPRLLGLSLRCRIDFDDHERVVTPDLVPFPNLQHLTLIPEYPFGDDVVFRGNASTLETLELGLFSTTISLLCGHGVFTPVSHPKLRHVNFECYEGEVADLFASSSDYAQFVLGVKPKAHMKSIVVESLGESLMSVLLAPDTHTCIQDLRMSGQPSLWEVFTLVKSLPLLSKLHTGAPTIDNFPDGVTKEQLLVRVLSNYTPRGERLYYWYIDSSSRHHTRAALSVLLLALVCPKFNQVATSDHGRDSLMKVLEETIDSEMFKPYAPRLRRLLPRGWDGNEAGLRMHSRKPIYTTSMGIEVFSASQF